MAGSATAASEQPMTWYHGSDYGERSDIEAGAHGPTRARSASRPLNVLVVDDEPQIVDFLAVLLEDEGHRVLRAHDGAQAWELIRTASNPPDLVITDVMMPRLSGMQLVHRLKENYNGTCPPVIVMSAVTGVKSTPGVRFLPKPFDLERMLALVTELTKR